MGNVNVCVGWCPIFCEYLDAAFPARLRRRDLKGCGQNRDRKAVCNNECLKKTRRRVNLLADPRATVITWAAQNSANASARILGFTMWAAGPFRCSYLGRTRSGAADFSGA